MAHTLNTSAIKLRSLISATFVIIAVVISAVAMANNTVVSAAAKITSSADCVAKGDTWHEVDGRYVFTAYCDGEWTCKNVNSGSWNATDKSCTTILGSSSESVSDLIRLNAATIQGTCGNSKCYWDNWELIGDGDDNNWFIRRGSLPGSLCEDAIHRSNGGVVTGANEVAYGWIRSTKAKTGTTCASNYTNVKLGDDGLLSTDNAHIYWYKDNNNRDLKPVVTNKSTVWKKASSALCVRGRDITPGTMFCAGCGAKLP